MYNSRMVQNVTQNYITCLVVYAF